MTNLGFQVEIIKTNRKKSASIQLTDGQVRMRVPRTLSEKRINDLIKKRTPWIKEKLEAYSNRPRVVEKKYIDSEIFTYLGKKYPLKIIESNETTVKLQNGYFEVSLSNTKINKNLKVKNLLSDWYRLHALKYLQMRTDKIGNIMGVFPYSVSVKNYKSRWGSCSKNGAIDYNWRIIQAPKKVIDYIIVHELCHLIEHNHSPRYWNHVEKFEPNWKERRNWLKENSDLLKSFF